MLKDCRPKPRFSASARGRARAARCVLLLTLLLGVGLLAGCGQKGDLYLPDENPEDAARR